MPVRGRTLDALGPAGAPRDDPPRHPGAWPAESGLLDGGRLPPLDRLVHDDRVPVLAIGSSACPGQPRRKTAEAGIASPVPMARSKVTGIGVGVSAHISRMGHVAASPAGSPGTVRALCVSGRTPSSRR